MSVREGVFYARFAEGTPFSLDTVKDAVRRAGLTYRQTELVARGRLAEAPGETPPGLLLVDEQAAMVLLLTEGEDPGLMQALRGVLANAGIDGELMQVLGRVVETPDAERRARDAGADLVVTVERVAPATDAPVPPVFPHEQQPNGDWF